MILPMSKQIKEVMKVPRNFAYSIESTSIPDFDFLIGTLSAYAISMQ
jgi:hypothetical protein